MTYARALTVIDLLDIATDLLNTLHDVVKWGQAYISLDLGPWGDLVDGALGAGYLCWLHGGGCGKLVAFLLGVLQGSKVIQTN